MLITVSKSVDEGFSSLQEALDSIPQEHKEEVTIRIKPGIYEEKITVKQGTPQFCYWGRHEFHHHYLVRQRPYFRSGRRATWHVQIRHPECIR